MTIRLIDIEDQKRFHEEMETYNLRVQERMKNPGVDLGDWPRSPKQPEPMVDSRDKGAMPQNDYGMGCLPMGPGGSKRDPEFFDPLDFDGNSQSQVKGFASRWQRNDADGELESSDSSPFKTTK